MSDDKKKSQGVSDAVEIGASRGIAKILQIEIDKISSDVWKSFFQDHLYLVEGGLMGINLLIRQFINESEKINKWVDNVFTYASVAISNRAAYSGNIEDGEDVNKITFFEAMFLSEKEDVKIVYSQLAKLQPEKSEKLLSLKVDKGLGKVATSALAATDGELFEKIVDKFITQWTSEKKKVKKMNGHVSILALLARYKELSVWWNHLTSDERAALVVGIQNFSEDAMIDYFDNLNSMTSDERSTHVMAVVLYKDESIKGQFSEQAKNAFSSLKEFLKPDKGEGFLAGWKKGRELSKKMRGK